MKEFNKIYMQLVILQQKKRGYVGKMFEVIMNFVYGNFKNDWKFV